MEIRETDMEKNEIRLNKFNKILRIVGVILIVSIMSLGFIFVISYYHEKLEGKTIQSGQVWIYINDENNPYEKNNPRYRSVVDTMGDYVKYTTIFGDTITAPKSVFIRNSRKFK